LRNRPHLRVHNFRVKFSARSGEYFRLCHGIRERPARSRQHEATVRLTKQTETNEFFDCCESRQRSATKIQLPVFRYGIKWFWFWYYIICYYFIIVFNEYSTNLNINFQQNYFINLRNLNELLVMWKT